jgi:2,3-bisphosphoglycerate-dependent phosphoglycerate mutase
MAMESVLRPMRQVRTTRRAGPPGGSQAGCRSAAACRPGLGQRRREDGIAAVFSSDLGRCAETVSIAFRAAALPVPYDWRLRECDYGRRNGMPVAELHAGRGDHVDRPYPAGESWRQAVTRVGRFLGDLPLRWSGRRVLIVGHTATRWGLDHVIGGVPLEELVAAGFSWQRGWEYRLG